MAEGAVVKGAQERTKSVREIFNQARSIAPRVFSRSAQEGVMDVADRYAANIRAYLGNNYNIDTQVPVSVYTGRRNNRNVEMGQATVWSTQPYRDDKERSAWIRQMEKATEALAPNRARVGTAKIGKKIKLSIGDVLVHSAQYAYGSGVEFIIGDDHSIYRISAFSPDDLKKLNKAIKNAKK